MKIKMDKRNYKRGTIINKLSYLLVPVGPAKRFWGIILYTDFLGFLSGYLELFFRPLCKGVSAVSAFSQPPERMGGSLEETYNIYSPYLLN